MDRERLMRARALLAGSTPMARDCGRLCGAACCQPDADGQGGAYLFPGEEELLGPLEWARVVSDRRELGGKTARMLVCQGQCDRDRRPLGCMIFPLTPQTDENGGVEVRFDRRARAMCPLLRHGLSGMRRDFVADVERALRLIAEDEEGLRFLRDWEELERQYELIL